MRHSASRRSALKTLGLGAGLCLLGIFHRTAGAAASATHDAGAGAKPAPLTEAQRAALRGVIAAAIDREAIPGAALAVLSRGEVVFREAFGRAEFESERPFTAEAPCFIASVTKPISATFFASLDERGVIALDDPVEKFLPEFRGVTVQGKGPARVTLRVWHCLAHRSGLPGNADLGEDRPQRSARGAGAPAPGHAAPPPGEFSLAEVIRRWIKEGLLAEPGARFAYGSSGYMVAARIAEVVLGRRYELLLQERLLAPLGMQRTTFHPDAATLRQLPARYLSTPNGPQRDTRTMPLPAADGLINPAGGLCSRLDDLTAFLALHLNGGRIGGRQFIKGESLARMYRPHPPRATETAEGGGIGYGLGWNVQAPGGVVRHLGASGTLVWLDRPRQHAGVLLTQVKWGATRAIIPRLMNEVHAIFPVAPPSK